jgi:penicillin-binding protein A
MTKQIRNLGIFLVICYVALFAQVNRLTVFQADDLQNDPRNTRAIERDFNAPRGSILTADGVLVAQSVDAEDSPFDLQRVYPTGDLFGHITGYFSLQLGRAGLEQTYNDELAGHTLGLDLRSLDDFFLERERVGNLTLTMRNDVQEAARNALGDRPGSVVALDPRTGGILAMWSPSFDPNVLSSHNFDEAERTRELLDTAPEKPLLSRAYGERFFPGSTFKVITAAAGIEAGNVTVNNPTYPNTTEYLPPRTTRPIRNFGGGTCGGSFFEILAVSCNTAFAQMGVEHAGAAAMVETTQGFGFNAEVPLDLPNPAQSSFPGEGDFELDEPRLAQSAIGQRDVQATPLQMALVAATVANGGEVPTPHVVSEVRDSNDRVVQRNEPGSWRTAVDPGTAELLRQAMIGVVEDGTATNMQLGGFEVGGKTGTAQLGTDPPRSHAWIIGFAGPEGQEPEVAVAVIVEGQEGASEQTGGRVAAPIAREVLAQALAPPTSPAP